MLRFAPSPTGHIHIGNLRAAIFNYITAKQKNERFLVRIEDTDLERNKEGSDKELLSIMNLFGLFYDELVYQSGNFPLHAKLANKLIEDGHAYLCYATKEYLDAKREEAMREGRPFRYKREYSDACQKEDKTDKPVIRLRVDEKSVCFHDLIKGEISFSGDEIADFVIMRNDIPTYNFACACDDMFYDISLIIRGEDHISNTPKQILVQKYLGYDKKLSYAHLPIILNSSGKKMSKREADSSVEHLLSLGFLPSAITNYLLLIGSHITPEVFTLKEAIDLVDVAGVAKAPMRFDLARLRHINKEHLRRLLPYDLALLLDITPRFGSDGEPLASEIALLEKLGAIAHLYLEEADTINELRDKIGELFAMRDLSLASYKDTATALASFIVENAPLEVSFAELKELAGNRLGIKGKELMKSLRFVLSNKESGVDLNALYPLLVPFSSVLVGALKNMGTKRADKDGIKDAIDFQPAKKEAKGSQDTKTKKEGR